MVDNAALQLWGLLGLALFLGALVAIFHVLTHYRTAHAAVAWILSLLFIPFLSLPLYLLLGRNRFEGYIAARRSENQALRGIANGVATRLGGDAIKAPASASELAVIADLVDLPFTRGNAVQLLVDGIQTYQAMFEAIESAREFILLEFYMVKDDSIGQKFRDLLLARQAAGVQVYFLYDDLGSAWLSRRYLRALEEGGVQVRSFNTVSKRPKRLQLNFRNHRKILVIDGHVGFVGGINIGDEYAGKDESWDHWRDTHVRIRGPAVRALQLVFVEDWYWSANEVPDLSWQGTGPEAEDAYHPIAREPGEVKDAAVLFLPTSAADPFENCELFFIHAFNSAQQRIWLASPYFVPGTSLVAALQLAALRGVDVRILVPAKPENLPVYLATFTFFQLADFPGIRIWRYGPGFMHQKVMLIDDRYASVGTINLDNRSMHLNFEVTALVSDPGFARQVEHMLQDDFQQSEPVDGNTFRRRSMPFRVLCQMSRLASPLL